VTEAWFLAFAGATITALLVTEGTRQARHDGARAAVETALGPLAGVVVAVPFAVGELDGVLGVALVASAWLWWAGFLTERGRLPRQISPVALPAAAIAVVAAGLRFEVTGTAALDAALTVALVWLASSAWRSAETRDVLLAGWAGGIGATAALLGGLAGQDAIAVLGAALAGACLGTAAFLTPPIEARLRRPGAMFIGFLATVLAIDALTVQPVPAAAVVATLLLALPVIDTLLVLGARLRGRGRDVFRLGLVARWRALGASRGASTAGLALTEAVLAFLALLAGRGLIAAATALAFGALLLTAVVVPALFARLDSPRGRLPRVAFVVAGLMIAAVVMVTAPAALAVLRARSNATSAAEAAQRGLSAAQHGHTRVAAAEFRTARRDFVAASQALSDPVASLGLSVPILAPNLRAARQLASIGVDLADVGQRLASTADPQRLRLTNGTLDLEELRRLQPELDATARALATANVRMHAIDHRFLVGPLEQQLDKLDRKVERAARDGQTAALAARVLPGMLGGSGPRRYFVAMQNNAEARATGGLIGNYGELTAANGHLDLAKVSRITELNPKSADEARVLHAPADYVRRYARFQPERRWQSTNASPDFPTVGAVIADLYPQSGGPKVDGVVSIDPVGLSSVLRLTGPISVASWPDPITADNVVAVTLRDAYVRFADDKQLREQFLADVAQGVWHAFASRDLGNPAHVLRALGEATRTKHLMLWMADPEAERLVERAHAAGAMPRPNADLVMATTQSAGNNKIDPYLKRRLGYSVEVAPYSTNRALARGRVTLTLTNTAPASGLPTYVIGPNGDRFVAGENRSYVTIYTALPVTNAWSDGHRVDIVSLPELGYHATSLTVSLTSGQQRTITLDLAGQLPLRADHRYRLNVARQPLISPDTVTVNVWAAPGWRLGKLRGLKGIDDGTRAVRQVKPDGDLVLAGTLEPYHGNDLWGRLQDGG